MTLTNASTDLEVARAFGRHPFGGFVWYVPSAGWRALQARAGGDYQTVWGAGVAFAVSEPGAGGLVLARGWLIRFLDEALPNAWRFQSAARLNAVLAVASSLPEFQRSVPNPVPHADLAAQALDITAEENPA